MKKLILITTMLAFSAGASASIFKPFEGMSINDKDKLYINSQIKSESNRLSRDIKNVNDKANAGVASAVALGNIPYMSGENVSFGMGLGFHDNSGAMAAGVTFKPIENGHLRFSVAHNDEGVTTFGSGFAFGF